MRKQILVCGGSYWFLCACYDIKGKEQGQNSYRASIKHWGCYKKGRAQ